MIATNRPLMENYKAAFDVVCYPEYYGKTWGKRRKMLIKNGYDPEFVKATIEALRRHMKDNDGIIEENKEGYELNRLMYGYPRDMKHCCKLIFSGPATILFDEDGYKTVVKCAECEDFDHIKGFMACLCKKLDLKMFKRITKRYHDYPEEEKIAFETFLLLYYCEEKLEALLEYADNVWNKQNKQNDSVDFVEKFL